MWAAWRDVKDRKEPLAVGIFGYRIFNRERDRIFDGWRGQFPVAKTSKRVPKSMVWVFSSRMMIFSKI